MREIFPIQRTIEQIDIADIKIDVRSRDDILLILLGLQHIYCTADLREKVFEIIKEMLPTQDVGGKITPVSAEKGCPGMNRGRHLGHGLDLRQVHRVFIGLRDQLGWINRGAHNGPRIHDLRHTFVVRRVLRAGCRSAYVDLIHVCGAYQCN